MPPDSQNLGFNSHAIKPMSVKQDGNLVLETEDPNDLVEPTEQPPGVLPDQSATIALAHPEQ